MHSSTGKDAEMSREPRAQTESDGEDVPSPQQRSIVPSPEGSDIFLQSLLAVLISLHMSGMEIEFVWRRGRVELAGRMPLDCLRVPRFVHVSANDS